MPVFRIAIIGAGPAGCTLGRLLYLSDINFVIFERESSRDVRSQGGTLDLRPNKGLAAIKAAQLEDEFLQYARYDGEALAITDKNLKSYISLSGKTSDKSGGRPEIDRRRLRSILLDSLPDGAVQWGCYLKSIGEDLVLHFEGGRTESGFDLIVGADGAWSKTRRLLTGQTPIYSGICGTELYISDIATRYTDLYNLVNKGSIFSYSDGHSVSVQQTGDGSMRVADWGVRDQQWVKDNHIEVLGALGVKKMLATEYKSWDPQLQKLFSVADDDSIVTRSLFMIPKGSRWVNKPGVTLIGDAAHVMVPFAGEGANMAMADAMELAQCIAACEGKEALIMNMIRFEEDMAQRAYPSQEWSEQNMEDMFFTVGAPRTVIERYVVRALLHTMGPAKAAVASVFVSGVGEGILKVELCEREEANKRALPLWACCKHHDAF
ncbi:Monooxygenase asqM [Hyphodiscus hymeniophilus]|uniref:Monooxygenase asqM n=1 Tax=Hyphodiscus hymeniophilus TaxID=353542 RepID=A0A9P6VQW1_9HELO|nr:Monooxygenase asqM [Hyphodiscus hymeniophilus]